VVKVYADVMEKGNLLSHSKFNTEFSEICHIFISVFVIPGYVPVTLPIYRYVRMLSVGQGT
jgi:hypothetical protein